MVSIQADRLLERGLLETGIPEEPGKVCQDRGGVRIPGAPEEARQPGADNLPCTSLPRAIASIAVFAKFSTTLGTTWNRQATISRASSPCESSPR